MAGKEIRVVAGDRGGWNAIEPPLLKALDAGCSVAVLFVETCAKQHLAGKLALDARFTVESYDRDAASEILAFLTVPHALTVVGSSQSERGTNAAVAGVLRTRANAVLTVQDMYGSIMPTLAILKKEDLRVNRLCVTDVFARQMVLQQYPELDNTVVITGGPHFDKTLKMRRTWHERRQTLRQALGVSDDQPVFLIAGGVNGTAEILLLLEEGIKQARLADKAKVILRQHPHATDDDKRLTEEYMKATKYPGWFTDVERALAPTSDDLLPAANFVLSGYSTTNTFGILYQMPGVVYVGTPAFQRDLKAEKGLDRPPEVEAGAAWYVQTAEEMATVITAVLPSATVSPKLLKIVDAQSRIAAYNDGQATERVWQEMQKLMA